MWNASIISATTCGVQYTILRKLHVIVPITQPVVVVLLMVGWLVKVILVWMTDAASVVVVNLVVGTRHGTRRTEILGAQFRN